MTSLSRKVTAIMPRNAASWSDRYAEGWSTHQVWAGA
jgi:hypothetical protein